MGEKLVRLSDVKGDNGLWTIEDMLLDARKDFAEGRIKADKAIVIFLSSKNSDYLISHYQVDMRVSEIIALMEVVKTAMTKQILEEGD